MLFFVWFRLYLILNYFVFRFRKPRKNERESVRLNEINETDKQIDREREREL